MTDQTEEAKQRWVQRRSTKLKIHLHVSANASKKKKNIRRVLPWRNHQSCWALRPADAAPRQVVRVAPKVFIFVGCRKIPPRGLRGHGFATADKKKTRHRLLASGGEGQARTCGNTSKLTEFCQNRSETHRSKPLFF